MYKNIKITKKVEVSYETFKKSAKTISKVYKSGFHKWTDTLNGISFYSIVVGTRRVTLVITNHNVGQCPG